MIAVDDKLSRKLTVITVFSTVLIVLFHVPRSMMGDSVLVRWLCNTLPYLAVPSFFALSGFLLSGRILEDGWWARAIKSRVKTLIIPFFCINLLYLPFVIAYHFMPGSAIPQSASSETLLSVLVRGMGLNPFAYPACNPLWYVRTLLLYVLMSPVVVHVIRKSRLVSWLAIGILTTLVYIWSKFICCETHPILNALDQGLVYSKGFLFFCGGMAYRMHGVVFTHAQKLVVACCSVMATAVCFYCKLGWIWWVPGVISICLLMPAVRLPKSFKSVAFPIYVLHTLVFYAAKLICHSRIYEIGSLIALICLGLVIPSVIFLIGARLFPRLTSVVFGGR